MTNADIQAVPVEDRQDTNAGIHESTECDTYSGASAEKVWAGCVTHAWRDETPNVWRNTIGTEGWMAQRFRSHGCMPEADGAHE